MAVQITPHQLKGSVSVPPSKSMAHRAIICASLARGKSTITNIEYSQDIKATISAMKALGTMIFEYDDYLEIDGTTTFLKNQCEIDCCESGSTLRFMVPISIVCEANIHFFGEGRLGKRPLDVYYDIFEKQGISYLYKENCLDLYVRGRLHGGEFEIPGNVSSQFISGLLFALPLMDEGSVIKITSPLESKGYIDLTLQMLNQYGIQIINHDYQELIIPGNQHYYPHNYRVEADFSQAAFYLVAGAFHNDVILKDLNLESYQGDKEAIAILERMGCELIKKEDGYQMISQQLVSTTIDGSQCPDIIPVIALACALAKGTSKIEHIGRLRIKECDRLHATVEVIQQLGGQAQEFDDSMIIEGVEQLRGGCVSSYNDHRMAMMEAIASTVCQDKVIIDKKDCVKKSYPSFWEHFQMLGGIFDECELGN
ncbi:3-phosphoshikimate 1-carboxyvinyltransferase [Candidatus Stoquefichus massiliensis]|uniref:3-phosphoshikimate 1-carboxyvinyltransferase n=1 Tax=Candidatus Stoquefichus massiliensis TaxID=1470350 RepID=UPI00048469DF|nr:3-phosphoshikimate 1-carboxyvinyltransferase [Candidatus Stoquefichus massiliensis]